jgi:hypothetical protein
LKACGLGSRVSIYQTNIVTPVFCSAVSVDRVKGKLIVIWTINANGIPAMEMFLAVQNQTLQYNVPPKPNIKFVLKCNA